jgi:hypothetical protein
MNTKRAPQVDSINNLIKQISNKKDEIHNNPKSSLKAKEAREMIAQLTKITKELENEISPYSQLKPKQKEAEEEPEQESDQGMQDQGSEHPKTEDEEDHQPVAIPNTKGKSHPVRKANLSVTEESAKRLNVYGYSWPIPNYNGDVYVKFIEKVIFNNNNSEYLMQPIPPEVGKLKFCIMRNKSLTNRLTPSFYLYLEKHETGKILVMYGKKVAFK